MQRSRASGIAEHITRAARLSDDDVRAIVRGASVFVVPSLIEGFGLPAVEAMAAGTPLVVSDIDVLREVTDGAALTFDPADPARLADAILRALDDDESGRERVVRGRSRAAQFTWSRAAKGTLAVYEALLEKGTGVVSPRLR